MLAASRLWSVRPTDLQYDGQHHSFSAVPLVFVKDFWRNTLNVLLYIVSNVVVTILSLLQLAMLARAILSMFMLDGPIVAVLDMVTEPFIIPIRRLYKRFNLFQNSPFDFSGLTAMILISVITLFLL